MCVCVTNTILAVFREVSLPTANPGVEVAASPTNEFSKLERTYHKEIKQVRAKNVFVFSTRTHPDINAMNFRFSCKMVTLLKRYLLFL